MNSRTGFMSRVAVLMSWTLLAQIVSVGSILILTRLLSPEHFGIYSTYSGIVVMLSIVAAGRYEYAINLPESDQDGNTLFILCLASAILVGILITIGSQLALAMLPDTLSRPHLISEWWLWIGPGTTAVSIYSSSTYIALRFKQFGLLGRSKATISIATAAGQIAAAAYFSKNAGALIIPFIGGLLIGSLLIITNATIKIRNRITVKSCTQVAERYARFPKYIAPASFLDGLSLLLPIAFISAYFSPAHAGIFALADRTLKLPVTLVGSSISQVFYERATALRSDKRAAQQLLMRTWRNLAALALFPTLTVTLFGEQLFELAFGAPWKPSGTVASFMVVGIFFYFISYPTNNLLVINEKVKSYLLWQISQFTLILLALIISLNSESDTLTTTIYLLTGAQAFISILSMILQWQAIGLSASENGP